MIEFKLESWSFDSKFLSFFCAVFFFCNKHSPLLFPINVSFLCNDWFPRKKNISVFYTIQWVSFGGLGPPPCNGTHNDSGQPSRKMVFLASSSPSLSQSPCLLCFKNNCWYNWEKMKIFIGSFCFFKHRVLGVMEGFLYNFDHLLCWLEERKSENGIAFQSPKY